MLALTLKEVMNSGQKLAQMVKNTKYRERGNRVHLLTGGLNPALENMSCNCSVTQIK